MKNTSTLNINSREHATSVVHTATRVLNMQKEKETIAVRSARKMNTQFKNVTASTEEKYIARTTIKMVTQLGIFILIGSTRENVCAVSIRVTKKSTAVREKNLTTSCCSEMKYLRVRRKIQP